MGSIRDLRKFINRLRGGPIPPDVHTLETLERTIARLQVDLQWAFSFGKEGMPPEERLRRANALCKAGHIILTVRDQKAISQNLNGVFDALEERLEHTEERREAFLNVHPKLRRHRIGRSAP